MRILYFPLYFAVNLQLLYKIKFILKTSKKKGKNIIYSINSQMLIIHIRNDESQNSVHNKLYNQLKNCCPCKHFLFFHSLFLPRPRAESQNHSYHAQK